MMNTRLALSLYFYQIKRNKKIKQFIRPFTFITIETYDYIFLFIANNDIINCRIIITFNLINVSLNKTKFSDRFVEFT